MSELRAKAEAYLLRFALALAVVLAWWYFSTAGAVPGILLPTIPDFLAALGTLVTAGATWTAVLTSGIEFVIAAAVATSLGVAIAFLVSHSKAATTIFEPIFAWGYMTPWVLFYPSFLIAFGVGMQSKIVYAIVGSTFPVTYIAIRAFSHVDERYVRMALAFGASKAQVSKHVRFQAAMPVLASGLRIGVASSLVLVIFGEMLGASNGLGFLLQTSFAMINVPVGYATTFIIIVLAGAVQAGFSKLLKITNANVGSYSA